MRKFFLILLIFLSVFIFERTNSGECRALSPERLKITQSTAFSQSLDFADFENYIKNENLQIFSCSNSQENEINSDSFQTPCLQCGNNTLFEKRYFFIAKYNISNKNKNLKFKINPRAP